MSFAAPQRRPVLAALVWACLILAGLAAGQVLQWAQMPAGLLLGPMIVGILMAQGGATIRVPHAVFQFAQGIAGCLIAMHLDAAALHEMTKIWPVVALFVALTFLASCIVGMIGGRWSGIDREVSIWGFLPGMASTVIAIAHERGLDSRMVALIQMVRMMVVIATMVFAAMALVGGAVVHGQGVSPPDAVSTLTVIAVACIGMLVARFVPRLPAGASLVPMVIAAGLSIAGHNVTMPGWLLAAAYLGLGAQIGLRMTPELLRTGLRALPALIAASLLLIVLCALSGVLLALITGTGLMSALLATVPGSIDSIALIAVNSGADLTVVMTLQCVRLVAVALLGPFVARGLVRMVNRAQPG